jgi:hypothetical protein
MSELLKFQQVANDEGGQDHEEKDPRTKDVKIDLSLDEDDG